MIAECALYILMQPSRCTIAAVRIVERVQEE